MKKRKGIMKEEKYDFQNLFLFIYNFKEFSFDEILRINL